MTFQAEDFLGYWLFRAQRSVVYAFYEALKACCQEYDKPYVVTPPQFGVLSLLDEQRGMTIGAISQKRGVDAATITGIVTRLEQSGLVERRHDRKDRRQVYVFLTSEGSDIMRYLPDVAAALTGTLMKGFTQDEQQDLIAKLQQILANLSAVEPDPKVGADLLPNFREG
ncbi:MAG TPA: MarR family transcriptional regulator [Ktedonobacteraceae bacterium]|nr:MarR family transcriptional regulator [Ktedonobacteraceae bacterium]